MFVRMAFHLSMVDALHMKGSMRDVQVDIVDNLPLVLHQSCNVCQERILLRIVMNTKLVDRIIVRMKSVPEFNFFRFHFFSFFLIPIIWKRKIVVTRSIVDCKKVEPKALAITSTIVRNQLLQSLL